MIVFIDWREREDRVVGVGDHVKVRGGMFERERRWTVGGGRGDEKA